MRRAIPLIVGLLCSVVLAEDPKPKVAVFPISGTASEKERERVAFSIRTKLDRAGVYEPIDGPTMKELSEGKKVDFLTSLDEVQEWSADEKPDVIIWGQMNEKLQLNVLDLRARKPKVVPFEYDISHGTEVRFAVEQLIETLPGSKGFEHPNEEAVQHDETAEKLWRENPNLMTEGSFDAPGEWRAILRSDKYAPEVIDQKPAADKVAIVKKDENQVLVMNISRDVAETNGMACLSGKIAIEPDTRYRISFRVKSDGPKIRPFVKGYCIIDGQEREIYRRQVPPIEKTGDQWMEVVDELNPQQKTFKVEFLRVDLYAYLHPGTVEWDDVVLKAVGAQNRKADDKALDKPSDRNSLKK